MAAPEVLVPKLTPIPDLPTGDWMDQDAWDILFAILDGAAPSITSESNVIDADGQIVLPDAEFEKIVDDHIKSVTKPLKRETVVDYLAWRPIKDAGFRSDIIRTLDGSPGKHDLAGFLKTLGSRTGALFLTGYWSPIHKQPTKTREAILKSWITARTAILRTLAKTFFSIALKAHAIANPYLEELTGYTDAPPGWKQATGYDFTFVQIEAGEGTHEMETDVVIVGSGCGGSVCAKNLSEAGHKVLLVEKAYYFPPSQIPMNQPSALCHMYDAGGVHVSDDASMSTLNASVWGGGGTVNWSACFKTPSYVRQEWADTGLSVFASSEYDECMDRVLAYIGASTEGIRHNPANQILLDGAKRLGWHGEDVARNNNGTEHYCGLCHLGCPANEKRGPTVAWLPDAARAGAQFMEGFKAEKVLFAEDGTTAIGVEGVWTSRNAEGSTHTASCGRIVRRVIIKAKKVIVSAGSIRSPILLMNSGIENPQLGKNLRLHPSNFVSSIQKEEIRPWEGGIITAYSKEFENLDGKGHGVKLEAMCMVPYIVGSTSTWTSGVQAKTEPMRFAHTVGLFALCRDEGSGSVYPHPQTGEPMIKYHPSDLDREHLIDGVEALAKILYVSGATEIRSAIVTLPPFHPDPAMQKSLAEKDDPEWKDPAFAKWLKLIRSTGNKPPLGSFGSAHQMSSCRMGADEESGVVDEKGRVWGKEGLYVADASVFPSASGVNPMVTTLSIADWISRGLAKDMSG